MGAPKFTREQLLKGAGLADKYELVDADRLRSATPNWRFWVAIIDAQFRFQDRTHPFPLRMRLRSPGTTGAGEREVVHFEPDFTDGREADPIRLAMKYLFDDPIEGFPYKGEYYFILCVHLRPGVQDPRPGNAGTSTILSDPPQRTQA